MIRRSHFLTKATDGVPKFLYLGSILRNFGYSFLGIFGNIFLFNVFKDFGFSESTAFAFILLRQAALYVLKFLTILPVAKLVKRVGSKTLLITGSAMSAISISLYALSQYNLFWLIPNIIVVAIQSNVFWIPYHTVFSAKNKADSLGKQMGILSIIGSIMGVVSPIISGLIIKEFGGYNVLFVIAFFMFVLSAVALYMGELDLDVGEIDTKDFRAAYEKEKRLFPDYFVIGFESIIQNVVWGIFIFLFIQDVLKLGMLSSSIAFAIALFTYFIGKLSDEKKVGGIDKFGAVFNSLVWIGKLFIQNGLHIFFLDSLFSLFRTTYAVPIDVIVYANAKHDNPMWPVIIREVALDMGRALMSIVAAVLIFLNFEYWVLFLIASVGYLVLGFLLKDNELENGK